MCREGVCGNGICEIGEATVMGEVEGACLVDCPLVSKPCEPGCKHGTCLASSGKCDCFSG